ncbi:lipase family protein [Nocardioides sp. R-C-SC26]|uniref:lipase family protein n=1 Tax=Nocardioides sp. R-C-SC26 TaxID=2870414 RepID=UPI001E4C9AD3|nr:lipase family protein [Nocardioides sp. R-C-SC26]
MLAFFAATAGAPTESHTASASTGTSPTTGAARSAASRPPAVRDPDRDPFYRWRGRLDRVRPGTVLRSRMVDLALLNTLPMPYPVEQLLYRTTGELGQPRVAVTTIIQPLVPRADRLVSYQAPYNGLGGHCAPSFTLRGGEPTADFLDAFLISSYLLGGYTVVVPDYLTTRYGYTAGHESAHATLDGIRAAQNQLGLSRSATRVAMVGYSGGAIASSYAAELAPTYASGLTIVATAAGGFPANLMRAYRYADGEASWSGAIPTSLAGLANAFQVDLAPYLTPKGRRDMATVAGECLDARKPHTSLRQMFKGAGDPYALPIVRRLVGPMAMGRRGTPDHPMLLAVGNADGRGDGVMLVDDARALAREYCRRGVPVTFREYPGLEHLSASAPFELETRLFVLARLEGLPGYTDCDA